MIDESRVPRQRASEARRGDTGIDLDRRHGRPHSEADIDDASMGSFPASDPPPWSGMKAGPPCER